MAVLKSSLCAKAMSACYNVEKPLELYGFFSDAQQDSSDSEEEVEEVSEEEEHGEEYNPEHDESSSQ